MKLLITLSQNVFEWTWKTSVYATLLIVLVFLLQKLLARWLTPRLRYAFSLLILIRLLLPIVPSSSLSFENLFPQSARLTKPAATLPISGPPQEGVISLRQTDISSVSVPAPNSPQGIVAPGSISLGWAAGCLCLVSLASWRYLKWNRLIKLGRPISDPKLLDLLNSARETMRVRSAVTLVAVSQLASPAVFGFRRIRLLLPEDVLRRLNDQELRLIFLHEMAHVRRKDVFLNLLLIAVQFLHWFNPLVWLALHRLRADRELVCDALVMQAVGPEERPGYGKVLLKLLDGFSTGHRVFSSAVPVVDSKHEIKRRILMIKHHRSSSIAACLATALVVAGLGCATYTRARGEKQPTGAQAFPPLVVRIDPQGDLRLGPDGKPVSVERLRTELVRAVAKTRELNLMLSLDRSAPLGQIVKVMDAAKEAGIKTVKCLTREAQGSATRQFCEQGWTHEQEKRYHEALADFTKALELDPENTEALFSRGCLYGGGLPMDKRDYAKAVADYSRFLAIKPRDCSARHNRAGCYEQLREYDKAIADYTRIIEGDTDFSRLVELVGKDKQLALDYHYRGRAYQWYKRDYVRAIADFTEALRLDPAGDDGMVNYRRGQCHQVLKHYAQAEADFRIALDRQPDYANLLCSWAWQLATAPDPRYRDGARALQLAAKGNEILNYQLPDHLDVLAAAYAENGKFDEAIETERKAIATLEQRGIPKTSLSAQGLPDDAKRSMQARLALYAAQRPFRNE